VLSYLYRLLFGSADDLLFDVVPLRYLLSRALGGQSL
jgi:hypothetical protein